MAGEPILIVDDNLANLKLVSFVLKAKGYEVRTALNADDAVAALRSRLPKLILMDLQLPGMSGLELTRSLKSQPATRDIPVIAVTAFAMKGDEQRALEAGCDAYITKPIDTRQLRLIVASLVDAGEAEEDE